MVRHFARLHLANEMLPFELTILNVFLVMLAFIAAGTSKGVLGVRIPLIAMPVLSGVMQPATTLAVLAVPVLMSISGKHSKVVVSGLLSIVSGRQFQQ